MPSGFPASWSHENIVVNGVRLHVVSAGPAGSAKPPVILLHGFPEFWYGWRHQIPALTGAGFRVIVPDMRGYNTSEKPPRVSDYRIEVLVEDLVGLIDHFGGQANVAGHDWGGVVAWHAAMWAPQKVQRLAILNAPHPATYIRELGRPRQLLKSWYAFAFQIPRLPERLIRANDFQMLRTLFREEPARAGAFTEADIDRYVEAFRQTGAVTAAIHYYRAAFRRGLSRTRSEVTPIRCPTLLLWGLNDRYLVRRLVDGLEPLVPDLKVEVFENATHWIQHDEPDRVNARLIEHFDA